MKLKHYKYFSRERCGLRPLRRRSSTGRITHVSIHHGGPVGRAPRRFAEARARWQSWQRFHQDVRGWSDIGYNLGVDRMGRLYQGRPVGDLPAAVGLHNSGSVAINFMQDGRYYRLNWMQRRTLAKLFKYGVEELGLPPLRDLATHPGSEWGVFGHQEYSGHSTNECPGKHIMRHLRWRRGRPNR